MKIIDDSFPKNSDEIALSKMTIEYTRELDCCQSDSDYPDSCQILTITTDDGGGGKFIRINTGKAGWSFDENDEIIEILNDFRNRLKCE